MRFVMVFAMAVLGCNGPSHKPIAIDAAPAPVDAAPPDAPDPNFFGDDCPIPTGNGITYYCRMAMGACIAEASGNHCRPWCGSPGHCESIGGKTLRVMQGIATLACVCVPN